MNVLAPSFYMFWIYRPDTFYFLCNSNFAQHLQKCTLSNKYLRIDFGVCVNPELMNDLGSRLQQRRVAQTNMKTKYHCPSLFPLLGCKLPGTHGLILPSPVLKILFSTFMKFFNMIDSKNLKCCTPAGRGHFKLLGPPQLSLGLGGPRGLLGCPN